MKKGSGWQALTVGVGSNDGARQPRNAGLWKVDRINGWMDGRAAK